MKLTPEIPLPVPFLRINATILQAAKLMISQESSEVFVVDDQNRPIGVVRHVDIVKSLADEIESSKTSIKEIMIRPAPTVEEDATSKEVSTLVTKMGVQHVLVTQGSNIIGLIEAGELFELVSGSTEKVEVFKAVSVRARIRLTELLSVKPMSVDELSDELGIKPVTVRHHIDVLRRNGIVEEIQLDSFGKVGRPLSLFKATKSILKRSSLPFGVSQKLNP